MADIIILGERRFGSSRMVEDFGSRRMPLVQRPAGKETLCSKVIQKGACVVHQVVSSVCNLLIFTNKQLHIIEGLLQRVCVRSESAARLSVSASHCQMSAVRSCSESYIIRT